MSQPDQSAKRAWRALAACRGLDVNLFHAPLGRGLGQPEYTEARKVCARCPVRKACLEFALENREEFGMWGGTTPQERERLGYGPPYFFCANCGERRNRTATHQKYCDRACFRTHHSSTG